MVPFLPQTFSRALGFSAALPLALVSCTSSRPEVGDASSSVQGDSAASPSPSTGPLSSGVWRQEGCPRHHTLRNVRQQAVLQVQKGQLTYTVEAYTDPTCQTPFVLTETVTYTLQNGGTSPVSLALVGFSVTPRSDAAVALLQDPVRNYFPKPAPSTTIQKGVLIPFAPAQRKASPQLPHFVFFKGLDLDRSQPGRYTLRAITYDPMFRYTRWSVASTKTTEKRNKKLALYENQDITTLKVDAIVNAANESLLGGGGVDGAIHAAAGPRLKAECVTLNGCDPGDAKMTLGYNLPATYVIHTVGPRWADPEKDPAGKEKLLASCYRRSLEVATANLRGGGKPLVSLVFPPISTGIFNFPMDRAAKQAVEAVLAFLDTHKSSLDDIRFVDVGKQSPRLKSVETELFGDAYGTYRAVP